MKEENNNIEENKIVLRFLKRVKKGVYAPIEESSLSFTRVKEEPESVESDDIDNYYFNIY